MRPGRFSNRRLAWGSGVMSLVALLVAGCQSQSPGVVAQAQPATGTATFSSSSGTETNPTTAKPAPTASSTGTAAKKELPRGGTDLFPRYRLVGYSGGAARSFGRLGIGDLGARVKEIGRLGGPYSADGREPLPVLELISTVVQSSPGKDGRYRARTSDAEIERYLKAARAAKGLLLLNIQPGRADFLTEVKALSRWLAEPDVGLALDPEWAVGPGQRPGHVYGQTSAAELNQVSAWLSDFTTQRGLPEKVLIVHQLAPRIITSVPKLQARPGLQVVISVDGIGSRGAKEATWRKLVEPLPKGIHAGFKLFFEEDRAHGRLMTPAQVLKLKPRPEYVLYE